nr:NifU family protein [Actinomycetota bacterium]
MSGAGDELAVGEVLERVAGLAEVLCAHPDVGDDVTELLDWVDAFHREGLGRLVEMIRAWRGEIFLEAVAADEVAGSLLAAYDLGEGARQAAEEAVARALAEVQPLASSHGGVIEVVRIGDGVVAVRLGGTCDGCPSSAATLTYGVEDALRRHWVSFRRLEVTAAAPTDPGKADLACPVPVPPAAAPPAP